MSAETSLISGYTQVDAFGAEDLYERNDDGEIEEEVTYVTLDLGSVEPTLLPSTSTYRLIGLDTPTPFLQLSGTIFKGQHQTLLGTELLFTDSKDHSLKSLAFVSTTEQRIRFKEVELREKGTRPVEKPKPEYSLNNKKNPGTMEQIIGKEIREFPSSRSRGSAAKDKPKTKRKKKAAEEAEKPKSQDVVLDDEKDDMDVTQD